MKTAEQSDIFCLQLLNIELAYRKKPKNIPFSYLLCFCDECVLAGQNVFLGPTIHLPRLEGSVESHHLRLIHLVYCCFQMRFQRGINPYMFPTF